MKSLWVSDCRLYERNASFPETLLHFFHSLLFKIYICNVPLGHMGEFVGIFTTQVKNQTTAKVIKICMFLITHAKN